MYLRSDEKLRADRYFSSIPHPYMRSRKPLITRIPAPVTRPAIFDTIDRERTKRISFHPQNRAANSTTPGMNSLGCIANDEVYAENGVISR
jgi:hypothetical protein